MILKLSGNVTHYGSLCIKDSEIYSFDDITSTCSGNDEIYIYDITNYNLNGYSTIYDVVNNTVAIAGLTHSGVAQTCTEEWDYSNWDVCSGSSQSRTAIDLNNCGTTHTIESFNSILY